MRRTVTALWLTLQALAFVAPAQAAEQPATVGLTPLALPVPAGFAEPSSHAPALRLLGERMTPPTNRLLAIFVSDDVIKAVQAGQSSGLGRYFMVQTLRQAEGVEISPADFAPVRTMLRSQYQSLLTTASAEARAHVEKAATEIGREAGIEGLQLKLGEMKGVDIFIDTEEALSLLALTKIAVQTPDKNEEKAMALSITTALIKRKLVYFYAYAVVETPADVQWVRDQAQAWLPQAQAANR